MDPFGVGSAELVAGSFTPFLEGVCKSRQGQSCHAFFMPEAKNKIYPLHMALGVTAFIPKQFVGSGKGLVQK